MGVRLSDDWDEDGWVMVPRNIVRDERLSWKATGLVAFFASHKAGFVCTREFIYGAKRDGKEAVESGLRELRNLGYLTVEQSRDDDGRLTTGSDYVLYRTPRDTEELAGQAPSSGFPARRENRTTGKPDSGKPATKREHFKERSTQIDARKRAGSDRPTEPPKPKTTPTLVNPHLPEGVTELVDALPLRSWQDSVGRRRRWTKGDRVAVEAAIGAAVEGGWCTLDQARVIATNALHQATTSPPRYLLGAFEDAHRVTDLLPAHDDDTDDVTPGARGPGNEPTTDACDTCGARKWDTSATRKIRNPHGAGTVPCPTCRPAQVA